MSQRFQISIGDQLFLDEGGEEIGAVRQVAGDHLVVYIENGGDFEVPGPAVKSAHNGKVVLDRDHLEPSLLAAALAAHSSEVPGL